MKDIRLNARALELAMEVVSDIQSQENPSFAYMVTRVQDALLQGMAGADGGTDLVDPEPLKLQENKIPFTLLVGSVRGEACLFINPHSNVLRAEYPMVGQRNTSALHQFVEEVKYSWKSKFWKIDIQFEQATIYSTEEGSSYRFVLNIPKDAYVGPICSLKQYLDNIQ